MNTLNCWSHSVISLRNQIVLESVVFVHLHVRWMIHRFCCSPIIVTKQFFRTYLKQIDQSLSRISLIKHRLIRVIFSLFYNPTARSTLTQKTTHWFISSNLNRYQTNVLSIDGERCSAALIWTKIENQGKILSYSFFPTKINEVKNEFFKFQIDFSFSEHEQFEEILLEWEKDKVEQTSKNRRKLWYFFSFFQWFFLFKEWLQEKEILLRCLRWKLFFSFRRENVLVIIVLIFFCYSLLFFIDVFRSTFSWFLFISTRWEP